MARNLVQAHRHAIYSFAESALAPIDIYKERKKSGMLYQTERADAGLVMQHPEMQGEAVPLDFTSWLPFSAPHYHISPDPNDYLLTPVIIMPTDLPNRNAVAFPLKELIRFNPKLGMQNYKTWKGKPTHLEHANKDITKAYGVIADSFLRKMTTHGQGRVWKTMLLLAFDRSKHADTVHQIETGEINAYSMGAWVEGYTCSYCNAEVGQCRHINKNEVGTFYELDGKLVHRNVVNPEGFETSAVGDPAYVSAISEQKLSLAETPNTL